MNLMPDGLLRSGFYFILLQVLRLRPGSLLMGGPPCGSFVWVNRSTSKRSRKSPLGDNQKSYVKMANAMLGSSWVIFPNLSISSCSGFFSIRIEGLQSILMQYHLVCMLRVGFGFGIMRCKWKLRITSRFVLLSMVAIARGCQIVWEQPGSSLMLEFPYLKFMAIMIQPVLWNVTRLSLPQLVKLCMHEREQYQHDNCTKQSLLIIVHCYYVCVWHQSWLLCNIGDVIVFLQPSPMGAYDHPNMKPSILFGTAHLACTLWEAFVFLSSFNAGKYRKPFYLCWRLSVRML